MSSGFKSHLGHFLSPSPKNKKIHPEKKFLIVQEMELSSSNTKKIVIFPEMKPCTFQPKIKKLKKSTPRKFLILQETGNPKKFIIFSQKKLFLFFGKQKAFHISRNGTFLCFRKGIFRTLAYLELEAYSEHCQTFPMECT